MMRALSAVPDLVERIRRVPDALREFTVGADEACALHGLDSETLANLCDAGFPLSGQRHSARYDAHDLANAALHLGRRSIQRRAMVSWRQTLEEAARRPVARYRITCPAGAWRRFALESAESVAGGPSAAKETVRLALASAAPTMPAHVKAVADGLGDLQFFTLPHRLRGDTGFGRQARMAGCGMAARLLVDDLRQAGAEARVRSGLLLAVPISTPHSWIETVVNGTWVAYDPHLLRVLVRHAALDPQRWQTTQSPQCILAPRQPGRGTADMAGTSGELTPMTWLETP